MMMAAFKTEQEEFWAGEFGRKYIERNDNDALVASNINLFSKALRGVEKIVDMIEFGANIGLNLRALKPLFPSLDQHAVEINPVAAARLRELIGEDHVYEGSVLEFSSDRQWDLVLSKGLLIHINSDHLASVYQSLFECSKRYVLICEYYNPTPVSINYRGHHERLFKRDFCGEMMDRFPRLRLRDYGFVYHRDYKFPQDDGNWFLLEKS
jgi:pseudaminic acid biosynthesis-associated methylase